MTATTSMVLHSSTWHASVRQRKFKKDIPSNRCNSFQTLLSSEICLRMNQTTL